MISRVPGVSRVDLALRMMVVPGAEPARVGKAAVMPAADRPERPAASAAAVMHGVPLSPVYERFPVCERSSAYEVPVSEKSEQMPTSRAKASSGGPGPAVTASGASAGRRTWT
jgi:hypothetical protein